MEVNRDGSYADVAASCAPALLRPAVMLTGDPADAEDLVQTTLLRAQRHGERIAQMAAPAAYLRRVLLNQHTSTFRALRRRVRTTALGDHDDALPDPTLDVDRRDETWRLLATLPRKQRAVLALRYYEDLPDREIAALLSCSEATVRSNAARALVTLRHRLTDSQEVTP